MSKLLWLTVASMAAVIAGFTAAVSAQNWRGCRESADRSGYHQRHCVMRSPAMFHIRGFARGSYSVSWRLKCSSYISGDSFPPASVTQRVFGEDFHLKPESSNFEGRKARYALANATDCDLWVTVRRLGRQHGFAATISWDFTPRSQIHDF